MRLREWYGYIFPELGRLVSGHHAYARLVLLLGNREAMHGDSEEATAELAKSLVAIFTDAQAASASGNSGDDAQAVDPEALAQRVLAAARRSIGADVG